MKPFLDKIWTSFVEYSPRLLGAVVVLFAGYWVMRLILFLIKRGLKKHVDVTMHAFVLSVSKIGLWIVIIMSVAGVIGIDTTTFITALGAAGIAIGLSLQASLSNLASGILILFSKLFKVGDYIEVAGVSGTVVRIELLFTNINSIDNKRIVIPNSSITANTLINYTHNKLRRVDIEFTISYQDNIRLAKNIILQLTNELDTVLKKPEPEVQVLAHTEMGIRLLMKVWCERDDYWDIYYFMTEHVKTAFDEAGIRIPTKQLNMTLFPPVDE